MTTQIQSRSVSDRLFPQAGSPRCPLCDQELPDHRTAENLADSLRKREKRAVEAHETRVRELLKNEHKTKTDKAVAEALAEQRKALAESAEADINRARAEEFRNTEKLRKQVGELQRQLEQKTSNELGEGAEIDLYEALRRAFEDDRIKRIQKGEPGADIRHEVLENGQIVGSVLYDSKNRRAWRNSYVEKLRKDQLAADADHAILSTSVFPSGERQLFVHDGVIVANPARVVELVKLLRQHMVRTHRLRLSAEQREDKTRALYEFIVSERYGQLISRFDSLARDLLEVDVKEKKAHETVWKNRGRLLREAQKAHADLASEIDDIVGGEYS